MQFLLCITSFEQCLYWLVWLTCAWQSNACESWIRGKRGKCHSELTCLPSRVWLNIHTPFLRIQSICFQCTFLTQQFCPVNMFIATIVSGSWAPFWIFVCHGWTQSLYDRRRCEILWCNQLYATPAWPWYSDANWNQLWSSGPTIYQVQPVCTHETEKKTREIDDQITKNGSGWVWTRLGYSISWNSCFVCLVVSPIGLSKLHLSVDLRSLTIAAFLRPLWCHRFLDLLLASFAAPQGRRSPLSIWGPLTQ